MTKPNISFNESAAIRFGNYAEEVVQWYFRLNGFFLLPSYIIHKDYCSPCPRTEADIMAVRFGNSAEHIGDQTLEDDDIVKNATRARDGLEKHLFALVEVKAGRCRINGPWSRPEDNNVKRAVERMGFAKQSEVDSIANEIYANLRWEGIDYILQYFCVGKETNLELKRRQRLVQITFDQIADFLFARFANFPQKIPSCRAVDLQWQGFGHEFAYWFDGLRETVTKEECRRAVWRFIERGSLNKIERT